ncbi:hypothetical protein G5B30_16140 [Sphingobacterium sp. SGG-5]|uniref:type IV toxin-antitoxin system AbiEi family antitoxin n=1 Tax=Sphingobacterium sp. SGG-5 TaxID=2710881 RepID=UPI0013EC4F1F|nr:type IV toxin-antitoxin system AbiEi family antitoxin [Sphingobacterium sp. SGG-5]NGM63439.1 hypothetical protein [Sphingobacterium sp. SGG-5]
MSTENLSKINLLLQSQPQGVVFTSSWMAENGYSFELQRQYRKSNWFESIGTGAMVRTGDQVTIEGALLALQRQLELNVHIGGKSALGIHGKAHYLHLHQQKMILFGPLRETLPKWFVNYEGWKGKFTFIQTDFLPTGLGVVDFNYNGYMIRISSPLRSIMECLYLAPKEQSLIECYEILEGLNNLRPQHVQELLERCSSVKVKRLFLYMADKVNHNWFKYLQYDKVDLGKGKRSIVPNGIYNAKYQITVPKELERNEKGI